MKRRGIALITTLMTMALLLTLVGAFVSSSRSASNLTGGAHRKKLAEDACVTGVQLAWAHMEKELTWGQGDIYTLTGPELQGPGPQPLFRASVQLVEGRNAFCGDLQPDGAFDAGDCAHFRVRVTNNINGTGPVYPPGSQVPVQKLCAFVQVTGTCGGMTRSMDVILRRKPISHASAVAGKKLEVQASTGLRIESRDPFVNQVRSGDDMTLPSSSLLRFLGSGDLITAPLKDAKLGSTNLRTASASARQAELDEIGGFYKTKPAPPEASSFSSDEWKLPTNVQSVHRGTWQFGGIDYTRWEAHSINYDVTTVDPVTGASSTDTESVTRYQKITSVYDRLRSPDGRLWVSSNERNNSEVSDPPNDPPGTASSAAAANSYGYASPGQEGFANGEIPTGQGDVAEIAPGFSAKVVTGQMAVAPGYKLKTDGEFQVTALGDRPPEMLFGYKFTSGGVAQEKSMTDGEEAARNSPETHMAALEAAGGIDIPGGALGFGSMIAGGDMTVKASSGFRRAPKLGVVLKAKNLTVNPATEPEPTLPGEPTNADQPIFKEGLNSYIGGGDWAQLDGWMEKPEAQRAPIVEQMRGAELSIDPAGAWGQLNSALGTSMPMPTLPGWSGPMTLDKYMRLKEFAQTKASGYKHGAGDNTWLDLSQHSEDTAARLGNAVGELTQWAKSYRLSLKNYLQQPPQTPDMFFQGLLHAEQNLIVNSTNKSLRMEGTMIGGKDVRVNGATHVDLVYDRNLTDDLRKPDGAGAAGFRLEKIFVNLHS